MSEAALHHFDIAADTLRTALEGGEADSINGAMAGFVAGLQGLQAVGAWRTSPDLKQKLAALLARLESDHRLARLLGDLTGQHLAPLAGTTPGAMAPTTYSRHR
jgi:hypothetical protein